MRALIMSSNQMACAGLRMILESRPNMTIVGEASTPSMALETAAHEKPDIILIDLDLYGINALELIGELEKTGNKSQVLILSDLMDGELMQKALSYGAGGVVLKVQPPTVLIAAIESLCGEGAREIEPGGQLREKAATPKVPRMSEEADNIRKIDSLTSREREIVRLISAGLRNKEIAERLSISDITVRHHLTNIFSKLDVSDRQKLLVLAHHCHLLELPHSQVS